MVVRSAETVFAVVDSYFKRTGLNVLWNVTQDADGDTNIKPKPGFVLTPDGVPAAIGAFAMPSKCKPPNVNFEEVGYGYAAHNCTGISQKSAVALIFNRRLTDERRFEEFETSEELVALLTKYFKPKMEEEMASLVHAANVAVAIAEATKRKRQLETEEEASQQRKDQEEIERFLEANESLLHALRVGIDSIHISPGGRYNLWYALREKLGLS